MNRLAKFVRAEERKNARDAVVLNKKKKMGGNTKLRAVIESSIGMAIQGFTIDVHSFSCQFRCDPLSLERLNDLSDVLKTKEITIDLGLGKSGSCDCHYDDYYDEPAYVRVSNWDIVDVEIE